MSQLQITQFTQPGTSNQSQASSLAKKVRGKAKHVTTTDGQLITAKSFPNELLGQFQALIRARPVIWDISLPITQRDPQKKLAAWVDIGQHLQLDPKILSAKFKSITTMVSRKHFFVFFHELVPFFIIVVTASDGPQQGAQRFRRARW